MEEYFKNSIAFYYESLVESGIKNPYSYMVDKFIELIHLDESQKESIYDSLGIKKKQSEEIKDILIVLDEMINNNHLDIEGLKLIKEKIRDL